FTACYVDSKFKPEILRLTLESVLRLQFDGCYISVSFHSKYTSTELDDLRQEIDTIKQNLLSKFSKKIVIYFCDRKIYQFQHLEQIYQSTLEELKDTNRVMFIDDDDII